MCTCYARWKDNLRVKKEGGGVPFFPWILCFPADLQPKQMGRADDLLMEGLPAQQSGFFLLTPTTTVSSPWNLGRNWSPRKISDWFRGRKRHSTFMLHSAGASAIAQIQGGGCCFLLRGKMLLTLEAIRSWAWSVRLNKLWVMRAGSGPFISRRLWGWRIGRPVSYSQRDDNKFMRSWTGFRVAVRRPS